MFGIGRNRPQQEAVRSDAAAFRDKHKLKQVDALDDHDALHHVLDAPPTNQGEAEVAGAEDAILSTDRSLDWGQGQFKDAYERGLNRGERLRDGWFGKTYKNPDV